MKKLHNKKGFTLVETLCAVALLLIVSYMMVSGMQFLLKNHHESESFSEAQILSKTLTTAISDELRYSEDVHTNTDVGVKFDSQSYGSDYYFTVKDGKVYMSCTDDGVRTDYKIISDSTYTSGNIVKELTVAYDDSTMLFNVNLVIADSSGNELRTNNFDVAQINNRKYKITT